MKFLVLIFFITITAYADIGLPEYNWSMTDIRSRGLTKEYLFQQMDREFIKTNSSICSNRALMWAHDFKRDFGLKTGKVFLFYTKPKEEIEEDESPREKTWWYHVAPIVNDGGEIVVLDAGFTNFVRGPLKPNEWLLKFSHSYGCKYIHSNETDLLKLIYRQQTFPRETAYGKNECYYKYVPHTYWTPESVAKNVLGVDRQGRPVRLERHEINKNELYSACVEATTSSVGRVFGSNKKACKEYAGLIEEELD